MVAAAYPHGQPPVEVEQTMERIWRSVAELSRLEGELETVARWDQNLYQRARELAARIGRRIQDLSHARSRLQRRTVDAREELAALRSERRKVEASLRRSRATIDALDQENDHLELQLALQAAGRAAAQQQMCVEAEATVRTRIDRWKQACSASEAQAKRYREQLHQQMSRVEADLASARPRLAAKVRERESLHSSLDEDESALASRLSDRPECASLTSELQRLELRRRES
jgi:chromosome segregation ATPase